MGLSATQMRFLCVTARKSNVEYQGQQINQARTALANQSADLYTKLMGLKAPTAPSVYQYVINPTTTPIIDWTEKNAFSSMSEEEMNNFLIHYAGNDPDVRNFNIPEYIEQFDEDNNSIGWKRYAGEKDKDGNKIYGPLVTDLSTIDETYCVRRTGKDKAGNEMEYYEINVPDDFNYTYSIEAGAFIPKNGYSEQDLDQWIQAYNLARSQFSTYSKPKKTAIYAPDADLAALKDSNTTNDPDAVGYHFYRSEESLSYNQAQYNAAMVQYKVDLEEYEKACDEINAKTEEIHEADKKLELQLKQLDTEQEAIQTEYDALKKVIEKNIENTFKTFG